VLVYLVLRYITGMTLLKIMLCYSAKGNAFEDLKFIRVASRDTGIIVQGTCLLFGRHMITE